LFTSLWLFGCITNRDRSSSNQEVPEKAGAAQNHSRETRFVEALDTFISLLELRGVAFSEQNFEPVWPHVLSLAQPRSHLPWGHREENQSQTTEALTNQIHETSDRLRVKKP
jgi:hypothetical protein